MAENSAIESPLEPQTLFQLGSLLAVLVMDDPFLVLHAASG